MHRAWWVAVVTLLALVSAAAFRSSTGVLFIPIETEFGWDRTTTSGAVSLNLVLYGLTAPFAAAIMERWGVRATVAAALTIVGVSSALTTVMSQPWHLWVLWGAFIGVGTGAMALVLGAIVANRWFSAHRGLVTGVFSAANATGQLSFLPVIAALADGPGWRWAAGSVALVSLALVPLVLGLMADRPADLGLRPYGEPTVALDTPLPSAAAQHPTQHPRSTQQASSAAGRGAVGSAFAALALGARHWSFWALAGSFFVCGWSTNGLIQTHFISAAADHGMSSMLAAMLLAMIGAFDIIGTIGSGWLTDRVDSRILLALYYGGRGIALLALPQFIGPDLTAGMWFFIIFYGLDWVATVPPTVALCRQHFGLQASGIVFGWVFASHMIGAGAGATLAGVLRQDAGTYDAAWFIAAVLCGLAAVVVLTIRRPRASAPLPDAVGVS